MENKSEERLEELNLFTRDILEELLPPEWRKELYATEYYRIYPQAKGTGKSAFGYLYFLWLLCNYGKYGWNGIISRYNLKDVLGKTYTALMGFVNILKHDYNIDIFKTYNIKNKITDPNMPRFEMENGACIYFQSFDYDKSTGMGAKFGDICAFFLDEGVPRKMPANVDMDELAGNFIATMGTLLRGNRFKEDNRHKTYKNKIPKIKFVYLPYNIWRPYFWLHTLFVNNNDGFPLTEKVKKELIEHKVARFIDKKAFDNHGLRIMRASADIKINPHLSKRELAGYHSLKENNLADFETMVYGFEWDGLDDNVFLYKNDFYNIRNHDINWSQEKNIKWGGITGGLDYGGTAKSRKSRTVLTLVGYTDYDPIYRKFNKMYIIKGLVYDVKKWRKPLMEREKRKLIFDWIDQLLNLPAFKKYIELIALKGIILKINVDPKKTTTIEELNYMAKEKTISIKRPFENDLILNLPIRFQPAITTGRWDHENRIEWFKDKLSNGRIYFNANDFPELYNELPLMEYNEKGDIAPIKIENGKRSVDPDTYDSLMYAVCHSYWNLKSEAKYSLL